MKKTFHRFNAFNTFYYCQVFNIGFGKLNIYFILNATFFVLALHLF